MGEKKGAGQDNTDDRFGQMVYDNLFMNKVAKDIAMATMRAPGWNIGTFRAGAGGITDLLSSVKNATRGEKFQITDRTAYLGALVATTMAVNSMLQYAMTGKGASGIDYFYPKTGTTDDNSEENRLMPKLYTYDYINMARSPVETALHKVSPLMGNLADLHSNKTFYGREIYDPGASSGAKLAQMAEYTGKQYEPFSASNYQEQKARGNSGTGSLLQSALGVLPAPKWSGRSEAENLANTYYTQKTRVEGGTEGDQFDTRQKYVQIQSDFRNGKLTADELGQMAESGEIPPKLIAHISTKKDTPELERWTAPLSPDRAMKVFDAATPAEKQRLIPVLAKKLKDVPDAQREASANKIEATQGN